MLPTLKPAQTVLLNPSAYKRHKPKPGDVVLAKHPVQPDLITIKRVASLTENAAILLGDNPAESTDSRSLGPIPLTNLLGRIECTFP